MSHVSTLIDTDIQAYLQQHEQKSLLRFITCGSVDDGKSTVIGRLLYDSKMLFEDQLAAIEADSKKWGTQGEDIDFALLVDGLAAEREQGITIDVAYRYFSTEKRKFIVADTPGHEQYTRNMITGASTADIAVILIDARKGVLTQTRRHSFLVSLIGIRKVVLAINKMDLMGYSEQVFEDIVRQYREFAKQIGLEDIVPIPLSALKGVNMLAPSEHTPWYRGPSLMGFLETVEIDESRRQAGAFRLPVQWVNRPNLDFRGFAGTIASGKVEAGDRIVVQPSGRESTVARIVTADGDLVAAVAGQSVTLTLADEVDVSRGDILSAAAHPAEVADRFEATLVWMGEEAMRPGRPYLLKIGARTVSATIAEPKYKIDVNTMEHLAATKLELNEIGVCHLALDRALPFDPYTVNRETGGFILIDRLSDNTVGAGMLHFALQRAQHPPGPAVELDRAAGAAQRPPAVVWFTGPSDAGAAEIARQVEKKLVEGGQRTCLLEGDKIGQGLNRDLGAGDKDRGEAVRRIAEVARLMVDAGSIVLVACHAPLRAEREAARGLFVAGGFVEVFVDRPPEGSQRRNMKGLDVELDPAYEAPASPELLLDGSQARQEAAASEVVQRLRRLGASA